MEHLQNLHTHTSFCDGRDTPEEMVEQALLLGFSSLGFSGHSYFYGSDYMPGVITEERTALCRNEVMRLKEKYRDRIKLYYGLEVEMFSEIDLSGYDYLIGSVHYLKAAGGGFLGFDRSAQEVASLIDSHFGGDGMRYARAYYEHLCELPAHGSFDIIGHFDLVAKHADTHDFFDRESKNYRTYALEAVDALAGRIPFFEVNTGAIARGYRKTPYPDPFLLRALRERGFGATISSDCHDRRYLDCAFADAVALLREAGFRERYILTDDGFTAVSL